MRWHCLQHVPFEGPGKLATWVSSRRNTLTTTQLWRSATFPAQGEYDGLFILGGPMNVYEVDRYPWLAAEEHFIARAISQRKPILGVCLGAQLLAVVLGGSITAMPQGEIGWHPVELTRHGRQSELLATFPKRFTAFHWHGDTFSIPPGAVHAACSEACENQAFIYENHVVGLQFHLESDQASICRMIEQVGVDGVSGSFIYDPVLREADVRMSDGNRLLFELLDNLSTYVRVPTSPTN